MPRKPKPEPPAKPSRNRRIIGAAAIIILLALAGAVFVVLAPVQPTLISPEEMDLKLKSMMQPAPAGVNMSGFEGDWHLRDGRCLYFAGLFLEQNRDWALVSATRVFPYSGTFSSHAFNQKGGKIFDPVMGRFFEAGQYYRMFRISNVSWYYYNPTDAPL